MSEERLRSSLAGLTWAMRIILPLVALLGASGLLATIIRVDPGQIAFGLLWLGTLAVVGRMVHRSLIEASRANDGTVTLRRGFGRRTLAPGQVSATRFSRTRIGMIGLVLVTGDGELTVYADVPTLERLAEWLGATTSG